ncbi:MAG: hypothetical protein JST44_06405 [Cyanobacteria bacterium SZAS LIN-5]|nr:hypothetical protein [Cyanobacteria bacterium SZAS LIN-5]
MASLERRRKLTLDEVNIYWHKLKEGTERANLHKLCNAIRTIDLALAEDSPALCRRLTAKGWSRIRDDCFDYLISSFPGHFIIYDDESTTPVEPGVDWPESGTLEFYPEGVKRREDAYQSQLERIHKDVVVRYRWCFAEGRQNTTPQDFAAFRDGLEQPNTEEAENARNLMEQLYEACAEEAVKLKKIAHRQWWQLHYEADACADRRHKNALRQQMINLELLWGKSTAQ